MNWLRSSIALISVVLISGCVGTQDVRGKAVPTAFFVFFESGSGEPTPDSKVILDEAAAFLKQYDNTSVRVVGHISPDETEPHLDQKRASRVAEELVKRGAQPARMELLGVGSTEEISGKDGTNDSSVDHRVEILFNTM